MPDVWCNCYFYICKNHKQVGENMSIQKKRYLGFCRHFKGIVFFSSKYYSSVSYYSNFVNIYLYSTVQGQILYFITPLDIIWMLNKALVLCSVTFTFPLPDSIMRLFHHFHFVLILPIFYPIKARKRSPVISWNILIFIQNEFWLNPEP